MLLCMSIEYMITKRQNMNLMFREPEMVRYTPTSWWTLLQDQGSIDFFYKRALSQMLNSALGTWNGQRRIMKEWVWLCFNKALFIDTEILILQNFHVPWNILLIFFQPIKSVKTILYAGPVQKTLSRSDTSLSIPVHQGVRLFPKRLFYAHDSLFHLGHNI